MYKNQFIKNVDFFIYCSDGVLKDIAPDEVLNNCNIVFYIYFRKIKNIRSVLELDCISI